MLCCSKKNCQVAAITIFFVIFVCASFAAQGYRLDPNTSVDITEYDPPGYTVTNDGSFGRSYFIPTNTKAEFDAFRAADPALTDITVVPRVVNPDFTAQIISFNTTVVPGWLNFNTRVCNISTTSAQASLAAVRLTSGATTGTCPFSGGGAAFYGSLNPGACEDQNVPIPPFVLSNGVYKGTQAEGFNTAVAYADSNCSIAETNESNNYGHISSVPMTSYASCSAFFSVTPPPIEPLAYASYVYYPSLGIRYLRIELIRNGGIRLCTSPATQGYGTNSSVSCTWNNYTVTASHSGGSVLTGKIVKSGTGGYTATCTGLLQ